MTEELLKKIEKRFYYVPFSYLYEDMKYELIYKAWISLVDKEMDEKHFLNSISQKLRNLMINEFKRKKAEIIYSELLEQSEEWTYEDELLQLKSFEDSIKWLSEFDKEVSRVLWTGASKQDCSDELGISYKSVRCSCDRIKKHFLRRQLITNFTK